MTDYGRDTLCLTELRTGRYATGVRLVAQRFFHALTTPRGSLSGDERHANWGDDLADCLGLPGGVAAEAAIRAKIARAAGNEDAIMSVTTAIVSEQLADGSWSHAVTLDAQTAAGPFTLVLSVDAVTVALLGFSEAA